MKKPISPLQAWLTVLSVACLLISNVVTPKLMQLPFGITMTSAVYVFPIVYILSDVFSEVYGYRWSRVTCYMAFAMNVLMVCVFKLAIISPAPAYWEGQAAFSSVLGAAPRTFVASLAAFTVGDFANDRIFFRMKAKRRGPEGFCLRAIVSSLAGEAVDSSIFLTLAFAGQLSAKDLFIMFLAQVGLKTLYEAMILPVTSFVARRAARYEERYNGR